MNTFNASVSLERQALFSLHETLCRDALALMRTKNADYGAEGPFDNFLASEALTKVPAAIGILVRMGDKVSRLSSVLRKGAQVKSETIEDTVLDLINYAVLFAAVVEGQAAAKAV